MFNDRGEWYVVADDGRSGERRTFRIDRIESVVGTGERGEPVEPGDVAGTPEWFADGGLPQVTLRLAPAATWVVERYPVDEVVQEGAGVVARFPVASRAMAGAPAAAPRHRGRGARPAGVADAGRRRGPAGAARRYE